MSANKFWRERGCALTALQNSIASPIAIVRPPAGNRRHHTSICEQYTNKHDDKSVQDEARDTNSSGGKKVMTDGACVEEIFLVVLVKVNGVMCRALIDSGAGSSYASAKLINALEVKPSEIKNQRIDMLMTSQTKKIEIYDVTISSLDGMHEIKAKLNKVDRSELLTTSNPNYEKIIREYKHLNSVKMDEYDTKSDLPIHLILGIGEYARIRTRTKPLVGKEGKPIAKQTKFGWVIMSPGVEFEQSTMLLTTTSQADFERLHRLDVLGLEDTSPDRSMTSLRKPSLAVKRAGTRPACRGNRTIQSSQRTGKAANED